MGNRAQRAAPRKRFYGTPQPLGAPAGVGQPSTVAGSPVAASLFPQGREATLAAAPAENFDLPPFLRNRAR